jgi:chromatin remodeling complex protein RSC6
MSTIKTTINTAAGQETTQPVVKKVIRRRVAAPKAVAPVEAAVIAPVETPVVAPVEIPEVMEKEEIATSIETEIVEDATPVVAAATTPAKRKSKGANKDRLFQDFEKLVETLDKYFAENNMKSTAKELKSVRDMTYRLLKLKTVERQKRDTNNSGFMKPVRVSGELEAFLKLNDVYKPDLTRAYLTTVLCSYIKTKNLQNPSDRRIIFPDENLKKLFQGAGDGEPLTYYTLQKRIQAHIFKTTPVETEETKK